jgi:diguanylate cyclase (GGDEF)-like protein
LSVESTLAVLAIAVVAILIILVVVVAFAVVRPWLGRRSAPPSADAYRDRLARVAAPAAPAAPARANGTGLAADARPDRRFQPFEESPAKGSAAPVLALTDAAVEAAAAPAYDRIVRIVALVFILAAITVVTASGVWPVAQNGVTLLLVVAALVVLVIHDLVPTSVARSVKFGIEGAVALSVATLLVVMTGRQASPFFLAFPLIVAGAALVVSARATVLLAILASTGYVLAIAVGPGTDLGAATVSTVSVNIVSLVLLAYVAMVIARMQRRSRDAAIRMSTIDAMTGLYNRPYLFSAIEQEISRSSRTGRGFCLLMMDLDELKTINDRYGHFIGDRALRSVADVIKFGVRKIDVPARYGGDEFVVLLPETDPTGGYVLGEKIRQGVAELVVPGTEVRTSMSVGMVSYPDDGRTADELMISADRAMYASKRLGKNRVMGTPSGAGGRADAPV